MSGLSMIYNFIDLKRLSPLLELSMAAAYLFTDSQLSILTDTDRSIWALVFLTWGLVYFSSRYLNKKKISFTHLNIEL